LRTRCLPTLIFVLIFLTFCTPIATAWAQNPSSNEEDPLTLIGTLKAKKISESSGLALSHLIEDAYWTMNDSGHSANVYMFGNKGQTLASCKLKQAQNLDWEAMSSFQRDGKRYLLVADVGDNLARRTTCELYAFEEPEFKPRKKKLYSKKVKAKKIQFRYEDGPRNCEAVACEKDGSAVYLIEKIFLETNKQPPGVYKLALPNLTDHVAPPEETTEPNEQVLIAARIADFPFRGVTGASISPDGTRLAIRNYLSAHLFERTPTAGKLPSWEHTFKNEKPIAIGMPLQVQGEAICFSRDNKHLIVTSETVRQPVWKVRIPSKKE